MVTDPLQCSRRQELQAHIVAMHANSQHFFSAMGHQGVCSEGSWAEGSALNITAWPQDQVAVTHTECCFVMNWAHETRAVSL